jgi:hypothetical protein
LTIAPDGPGLQGRKSAAPKGPSGRPPKKALARASHRAERSLERHEARLIWVESNTPIHAMDCAKNCTHPAGGYFVVK